MIVVETQEVVMPYKPVAAMCMDDLMIEWEWESLEENTIRVPNQIRFLPGYVVAIAFIHLIARVFVKRLGFTRFESYTRIVRGEE